MLTIHHIALPLHLLFCPKQGRYNTNKADLLIFILSRLKAEFAREGVDLTKIPLDHGLLVCLHAFERQGSIGLGFTKIIIAGKSNYTFTIDSKKQKASQWQKDLVLHGSSHGGLTFLLVESEATVQPLGRLFSSFLGKKARNPKLSI